MYRELDPPRSKIIGVDGDRLSSFPFLLNAYAADDEGVSNDHPFDAVGAKAVPEEVATVIAATRKPFFILGSSLKA